MTIAIVTFAVLCLILGILLGLARGLGKTISHFLMLAAASVLTFIFAPIFGKTLANINLSFLKINISGIPLTTPVETANAVVRANAEIDGLLSRSEVLGLSLERLVVLLCSVLSFILLFIILFLITWIIALCIEKPILALFNKVIKKADGMHSAASRLSGAALGFICAVLCVGMVFTPVLGSVSLAKGALNNIGEMSYLKGADDFVAELDDNAVLSVFSAIGCRGVGEAYLKGASRFVYEGETFYITDELDTITAIIGILGNAGAFDDEAAISDGILTALSDYDTALAVANVISESKLLKSEAYIIISYITKMILVSAGVPETREQADEMMWEEISSAIRSSGLTPEDIRKLYEDNPEIQTDEIDIFCDLSGGNVSFKDYIGKYKNMLDEFKSINKKFDITLENLTPEQIAELMGNTASRLGDTPIPSARDIRDRLYQLYQAGGTYQSLNSETGKFTLQNASAVKNLTSGISLAGAIADMIGGAFNNADFNEEKTKDALAGMLSFGSNLATTMKTGDVSNLSVDNAQSFGRGVDNIAGLRDGAVALTKGLSVTGAGSGSSQIKSEVLKDLAENLRNGDAGAEQIMGGTISGVQLSYGLGTYMKDRETLSDEEKTEKEKAIGKSLKAIMGMLNTKSKNNIVYFLQKNINKYLNVPVKYQDMLKEALSVLIDELLAAKQSADYTTEVQFVINMMVSISNLENKSLKLEHLEGLVDLANKSDVVAGTIIKLGSTFDPYGVGDMIGAEEMSKIMSWMMNNKKPDMVRAITNLFGIQILIIG